MGGGTHHAALAEFQRHEQTIDYLPWTPEVAFVDFLKNHRQTALRSIQQHFHNVHLNYGNADIGEIPVAAGSDQRNRCKTAFRNIVARIADGLPNDSEADVRKALIRLFAQWYWDNNRATVLQLFGPHLAAAMRQQQ